VGYEFLNLFRREQDKQWAKNRQMDLFNRFCELVVTHYRESREIQFYATLLDLTPKYLSSSIRSVAGMSPARWIEQYVITQAKRLIETYPAASLKEIAYMLGFDEPTSFYRYFKHATGMTAKSFRTHLSA
jgi:AraC-like DNA-binding protein